MTTSHLSLNSAAPASATHVDDPTRVSVNATMHPCRVNVARSAPARTEKRPAPSPPKPPTQTLRVYVAGPMTGYERWNFDAFADATSRLRLAGFAVTSPHEIDLADGFDPDSDGEGFDLRAALERDIEAVLDSDVVALLPGWEKSPGVMVEVLTATSLGIPTIEAEELLQSSA